MRGQLHVHIPKRMASQQRPDLESQTLDEKNKPIQERMGNYRTIKLEEEAIKAKDSRD